MILSRREMHMRRWIAGLIILMVSVGAEARDLDVPVTAGWQHAATGIILNSKIDGVQRTTLTDSTSSEHDVSARYDVPADGLWITVYIFHPAIPDVPMWFDRAQSALTNRDVFKSGFTLTPEPVAFATKGSSTLSSLRQTYVVQNSRYRSTALAAVPLGEWIVTVRMSSEKLPAEALDVRFEQFLAAIRWPEQKTAAPAAVPIKPCAVPLAFAKKAKVVASDMTDVLMSMAAVAGANDTSEQEAGKDKAPPPLWCRDGDGTMQFGVYRSDLEEQAYALVIADAGRVINVAPSLAALMGKRGRYSVTLTDVDGTVSSFPSFNALPRPEQALGLVLSGQPSSRTKGNETTIDSSVVK
jgi:hypothetical protein